jgi:hypothetical protein
VLSVAAALAFVLAIGAGGAKATLPPPGGSCAYKGMSATREIDSTVIQATWCWNAGDEITAIYWNQYQENFYQGHSDICAWKTKVTGQSAIAPTLWTYKATESLASLWTDPACGNPAGTWEFDLQATVWAPPNPGMSAAQTDANFYALGYPDG